VPFDCILFEELLHKGAFKIVHHAIVNYPEHGMMGLPVAVKRLKGGAHTHTHTNIHTYVLLFYCHFTAVIRTVTPPPE
jgi:tRNA G37 N-methylase Trm5